MLPSGNLNMTHNPCVMLPISIQHPTAECSHHQIETYSTLSMSTLDHVFWYVHNSTGISSCRLTCIVPIMDNAPPPNAQEFSQSLSLQTGGVLCPSGHKDSSMPPSKGGIIVTINQALLLSCQSLAMFALCAKLCSLLYFLLWSYIHQFQHFTHTFIFLFAYSRYYLNVFCHSFFSASFFLCVL